jgi:5'-phosphate synthase pdxT subunit
MAPVETNVIGILALQGSFVEHQHHIEQLGWPTRLVRSPADLDGLAGLILPGGESTTLGLLLVNTGLREPLRRLIREGFPVYGTCAGLILLADQVDQSAEAHLGGLAITVRRNAYGSQLDSFRTSVLCPEISDQPLPLVFIRAPQISHCSDQANILVECNGQAAAVRQNRLLGSAFHPELTDDLSFHRYFLNECVNQPG